MYVTGPDGGCDAPGLLSAPPVAADTGEDVLSLLAAGDGRGEGDSALPGVSRLMEGALLLDLSDTLPGDSGSGCALLVVSGLTCDCIGVDTALPGVADRLGTGAGDATVPLCPCIIWL